MNKVILIGRLTRDPEIRYAQNENGTEVARSLAVDRRAKMDGEQSADFIGCVVFGKGAEFAEKYLRKGIKIAAIGRIQTGSYTDRETGKKVYTTDVIIEEQEFAESKAASQSNGGDYQNIGSNNTTSGDGFMNVPDGIDEELLFN